MACKNFVRKHLLGIVIIILINLSACGYYSFKGALPSHIQSISIPIFVDRTSYPGMQEKVTDSVIEAFVSDNTLKVVDESKADLIISGSIQSVNQRAASVSAGEQVTEYQVYVNVKVVCEDIRESKKLYDKTFRQYGLMPFSGGQDEKDAAIDEAIVLITEDIVNTTLGGW